MRIWAIAHLILDDECSSEVVGERETDSTIDIYVHWRYLIIGIFVLRFLAKTEIQCFSTNSVIDRSARLILLKYVRI